MAKAVKFKNDYYLDSSSIVHNKTPLKAVIDSEIVWERAISAISGGATLSFSNQLDNGIYNLYFVRSVQSSENGIPITFTINNSSIWIYLNSSGWIQEANADAIARRNIQITKNGIYVTDGGYNKMSDGSYSTNNNICIPYKLERLLKY